MSEIQSRPHAEIFPEHWDNPEFHLGFMSTAQGNYKVWYRVDDEEELVEYLAMTVDEVPPEGLIQLGNG